MMPALQLPLSAFIPPLSGFIVLTTTPVQGRVRHPLCFHCAGHGGERQARRLTEISPVIRSGKGTRCFLAEPRQRRQRRFQGTRTLCNQTHICYQRSVQCPRNQGGWGGGVCWWVGRRLTALCLSMSFIVPFPLPCTTCCLPKQSRKIGCSSHANAITHNEHIGRDP